jgi:hypothetical protein
MNNHPLAEDYLRWLAPQIRDENDNGLDHAYWDLLVIMFDKEYPLQAAQLVPNDDNRLGDGLDLRVEFCYARHVRQGALADLGPCSFLEILIGLSRRLAFNVGGPPSGWAWTLLCNLELRRMTDPLSSYKARKIHNILDGCIWRNYQPDGTGGFFPLAWPEEDQRNVELWYQMAAWINELHPEHSYG